MCSFIGKLNSQIDIDTLSVAHIRKLQNQNLQVHGKAITEPDLFTVLKMHTTELFSDTVRQVCPHLTFHFPQMINVCVQTVLCGRKIQPRKQMFISNLEWSAWLIHRDEYIVHLTLSCPSPVFLSQVSEI